jgi:glyoxylase-like metal-dependent hydrolase (beta-lactamase superfamily II)
MSTSSGYRAHPQVPVEIAPGVHYLQVGKGIMASNVYLVRSGSTWVLVDTGTTGCAPAIREAAERLFGPSARPAAILLTHDHPDHAGSALPLARLWTVGVYVHPDEMPIVFGDMATFRRFANPLDRWLVLPLMRLMGTRRAEAVIARASIKAVTQSFDPGGHPPGLPDWQAVPTPGHSPGHVAFFRRSDRVLVAGDALVTLDVNSPLGLITRRQTVAGPPRYATWDGAEAKRSIAALASLKPLVLAGGHGVPMTSPETAAKVQDFARRVSA